MIRYRPNPATGAHSPAEVELVSYPFPIYKTYNGDARLGTMLPALQTLYGPLVEDLTALPKGRYELVLIVRPATDDAAYITNRGGD